MNVHPPALFAQLGKLAAMNARASPIPSKLIVAKNIKMLREHHNWTQSLLAEKSGVSQSTISNMEHPENAGDRYSPTTNNIDAVSAVFGLPGAILQMALPLDMLLEFGRIEQLMTGYIYSTASGRLAIEAVAEIASPQYLALKPPNTDQ